MKPHPCFHAPFSLHFPIASFQHCSCYGWDYSSEQTCRRQDLCWLTDDKNNAQGLLKASASKPSITLASKMQITKLDLKAESRTPLCNVLPKPQLASQAIRLQLYCPVERKGELKYSPVLPWLNCFHAGFMYPHSASYKYPRLDSPGLRRSGLYFLAHCWNTRSWSIWASGPWLPV